MTVDLTPQWDEYAFTPQKDMTAYELALILKDIKLPNSVMPLIAGARTAPNKPLMQQYARHFTKKVPAKP